MGFNYREMWSIRLMRDLMFSLLDDDHGISLSAWENLKELIGEDIENYDDILINVRVSENRVYLVSSSRK